MRTVCEQTVSKDPAGLARLPHTWPASLGRRYASETLLEVALHP
jgi:hypothetical protein